jgi:hypothetical protein
MTDGLYEPPLYVTDAEIVERMGVGINSGRKELQKMRLHPKFPPRAIGGKRYWPSVVDFLDIWNGRPVVDAAAAPVEQPHGHAWAYLQEAKKGLSPEMARALDRDPILQAQIASDEERLANGGRRRPGYEQAIVRVAIGRLGRTLK